MSEIRALLAASRDAHHRFQVASGSIDTKGKVKNHPDYTAAAIAIREALSARQEAEAIDPAHVNPTWADDQSAMRGISSDELVKFYKDYLS